MFRRRVNRGAAAVDNISKTVCFLNVTGRKLTVPKKKKVNQEAPYRVINDLKWHLLC